MDTEGGTLHIPNEADSPNQYKDKESATPSKKYPDYCRTMVIKDANGQVKELVFPKALDLDRPKRARTQFSPDQLFHLEREFIRNQYLVGKERTELADRLGLTETQVKVWFQNRRTKHKRDKHGSEALKSPPNEVTSYSVMNLINTKSSEKHDLLHSKEAVSDRNDLHHSDHTNTCSPRPDIIQPIPLKPAHQIRTANHNERKPDSSYQATVLCRSNGVDSIETKRRQEGFLAFEMNQRKNPFTITDAYIPTAQKLQTGANQLNGHHTAFQANGFAPESPNALFNVGHFPQPNYAMLPYETNDTRQAVPHKYEPFYGIPHVPFPKRYTTPVRIPAVHPHHFPHFAP